MNEVVKTEGPSTADTLKLWLAILIAVAGILAFYVMRDEQAAWVRWSVFAGSIVLGLVVLALSQYGRDFGKFVADARIELYKVFWPTREETGMTTLVVFVFVLLLALFFWGLDALLSWITRSLIGTGAGG